MPKQKGKGAKHQSTAVHTADPKKGLVWFDSPEHLAHECEGLVEGKKGGDDWYSRESGKDWLEYGGGGNPARVGAIETVVAQISEEVGEADRVEWTHDVAGARPDVAAFLSGEPECMWSRRTVVSEVAPVRIWFDIASSCGVASDKLEKRGAAVASLVMFLIQSGRPVELVTYCSLDGKWEGRYIPVVRMHTDPIDVGSLANALISQGFSRGLCYNWGYAYGGFGGGWARGNVHSNNAEKRAEFARKDLLKGHAGDHDVICPAPFYGDDKGKGRNALMFSDPARWVRETAEGLKDNASDEAMYDGGW